MPIYEYECSACGQRSSILYRSFSSVEESPLCRHCNAPALSRIPSRPGLIQSSGSGSGSSELRPVDPRRAVEQLSRGYDQAGVDPGRGFEEVAQRAAAGDRPEALKEMVQAARKQPADQGGSKP